MKNIAIIFALVLYSSLSFGQVYFSVEEVHLSPENPNTHDSVEIVLTGFLSNTGAYVDNTSFEIIDDEVFITVNCNTNGGFAMLIDHEVVMNLGLLQSGDYHINLAGVNFGDNVSEPSQYLFSISEFTNTHFENNIVDKINVFPNPSSGIFYLDNSDILRIEIFNNTGKLVSIPNEKHMIDLSHFPDGIYYMRIYKYEELIQKVLVKK